jgi:hypothetical protein
MAAYKPISWLFEVTAEHTVRARLETVPAAAPDSYNFEILRNEQRAFSARISLRRRSGRDSEPQPHI